jgi:hypothetical protein
MDQRFKGNNTAFREEVVFWFPTFAVELVGNGGNGSTRCVKLIDVWLVFVPLGTIIIELIIIFGIFYVGLRLSEVIRG